MGMSTGSLLIHIMGARKDKPFLQGNQSQSIARNLLVSVFSGVVATA